MIDEEVLKGLLAEEVVRRAEPTPPVMGNSGTANLPPINIILPGGEPKKGLLGRIVTSLVTGWLVRIALSTFFFGMPTWVPFILAAILGLFGWTVSPPGAVGKAIHEAKERVVNGMNHAKERGAERVEKAREAAADFKESAGEKLGEIKAVARIVNPPSFVKRRNPNDWNTNLAGMPIVSSPPGPPPPVKSAEDIAREEEMRTRLVTAFGETKSIAEWAKDPICRVKDHELWTRVKKGWEAHKAIDLPSYFRSGGIDEYSEGWRYQQELDRARDATKEADLARRRSLAPAGVTPDFGGYRYGMGVPR